MKKYFLLALLMVPILVLAACAPAAPPGIPQKEHDAVVAERDAAKQLVAVLQAVNKYHDVTVALADGYAAGGACVSSPAGAMGLHYVNQKLIEAPVDSLKPAILLYLPTDKGVKLIGVEYGAVALAKTAEGPKPWFKGEKEPPTEWVTSVPSVLGKKFNGPMAGHGPVGREPWHYDLHVWLWGDNPSGFFADFNPNLKCPPPAPTPTTPTR